MERLSEKLWTTPAHVGDGRSSTAFHHWCKSDKAEEIFDLFVPTPIRAQRTHQP
jgi:hypothetical protein